MTNNPGGWTAFRSLTEEDKALFNKVMKVMLGVTYKPIVVATQVVNGINYCFICRATMVTNPPVEYNAEVIIYQPSGGGEPHCTEIKHLM